MAPRVVIMTIQKLFLGLFDILIEEDHMPTKQALKEMLKASNLAGLLVYFNYVFFHASSRMLLCFHVFMLFSRMLLYFSILKTNTKYGF
jgi:hypothetical protein